MGVRLELALLEFFVRFEDVWVHAGRPLMNPCLVDLDCWVMCMPEWSGDASNEAGKAQLRAIMLDMAVLRKDRMVHTLESLVPGCSKFVYMYYDWGDDSSKGVVSGLIDV